MYVSSAPGPAPFCHDVVVPDPLLVDACVLPENILNGDYMLKVPGNR